MIKYYTRACNFYYGYQANQLIKKKQALPLCGNKGIAFNTLEVFKRKNKKISKKFLHLKEIQKVNINEKKRLFQICEKLLQEEKTF